MEGRSTSIAGQLCLSAEWCAERLIGICGREPEPASFWKHCAPIVSQFTFARHGLCYSLGAGDFRGPVMDAAGTRHFEPDGVIFGDLACLPRPRYRCPLLPGRLASVEVRITAIASQLPHPDQCSGLPATGLALTISLAGFGADPRPARRESSSDVGPRSPRPRRLVKLKHRIVGIHHRPGLRAVLREISDRSGAASALLDLSRIPEA